MAKMGIGSKISVILVLIIFVNCSIIAQEDEKQWEDPINLQNNPSEALLTQTGWKTLQENPSLMKESNVADAAFQHSATEAAKIVNKNIDLLSSGNFRTKFKEAIINNQGQDGKPTILNDNPAAKKEFFKKEYDIGMVDEKLEILKFDGRILTTGGTGSSSLAPPDEFSKAVIQKEGSIEFEKNSFSGTTLSREGETIKVSKGFVTLRTDNKITIEAEDVLDFTVTKENKEITYSGTFTFKKTDEENIVNGKFFRFFGKYREYKVQIDGKISDPKNTKPGEYFLVGHVTLKYNEGKNGVIEVKGNVLYTEEIGRRTASICNNYVGSSCIVNPNAYNNLKNSISSVRFLNIQGGDKISFKTPQYISSVEFNNVLDGEVTFTSQNGGKQTLVKVGPNSKTDVQGDLNNMNIGRLDVIYETDAEPNVKYVKHWHSNENLPDSVKNYFADARANPKANSLV
ncbi:MAG: hypothetical protein KJ648_07660, partial [Candidatus Omnitrophica bacterium]|nr:hypothetical protein [Candidatus Omnitrophota bacterium]